VVTARGRIVVTGTGPDHGPLVTATHQLPLRVGRETSAQVLRTNLLATYGYAFSSLVHTPAGPQVLAMGDTSGWLRQLQPATAGRWTNAIVGDCNNCADPSAPLLMYGKAVSATTGASGDIHAAYFSLFHLSAPVNDPHCAVCAGQGLRYQHFANGAWSREGVDIMGTTHGDCGIALDGAGTVYIAYNAGAWNNHTLRIRKRVNGAWVNAVPDLNSFPGRPPIDPHEIQLGLATGGYFAGGMYVSFINRWTGTEQVYMEDGADWVEVLRQYGADGQSAMDVDANGYARVVYTTRGSTPGSHRLWFRQMVFNRTTSFLGFMPPELIDSTALAVEDVRLAHADLAPVVAYAANGALVYRVRKSPGVWNREVIELSHDVGGPIGLDQMPNGERRFTYRDAADDQLRYITIPSGSVGVGDGDGAPRRDTATLVSQNPLIRGGRLRFELDLRGPAALELALFDLAGRRVASRRDPAAPAGRRTLEWGPGNQAPGVYFVRVLVGGRVALSRRLVLI